MIKAIDDKVIIEELKRTKSEGGIIFPENAGDPQAYGKVISLGADVANKQINVGDVVIFHVRGGQAILMSKRLMRVLKYDEIYGILEDGELKDSLVEMEIKAVSSEGTTQIQPVESNIIRPVS
jgi:co-chaperonin GroES (HSP10)